MSVPDHDADEQIVWQGKYITAKTRGRWEYVGRPRNIRAAVILAVDEHDHVLLVEQYRVPLGCPCIELPAGLIGVPAGVEPALVSGDWAGLSTRATNYRDAGAATRRGDETGDRP